MKRALTGIAAAAVVLGTIAPAAFASTTPALTAGGGKTITVDGTTLYSGVQVGNAKDAGTTTTYFPIWYLQQALTKAGYSNTYNPSTSTWDITIPGVDASTITVDGGVGTGNAAISINGTVVKKFNAQWAKDLAGGKNASVTTYFPIYYLGNVLQAAGFSNAWDGSTFGFNHAKLAVRSVSALNADQIKVVFAKKVDQSTAEDVTNYTLNNVNLNTNAASNGAPASTDATASLQADGQTVIITSGEKFGLVAGTAGFGSLLQKNTGYVLNVNGVKSADKTETLSNVNAPSFTFGGDTVAPTVSSVTSTASATTTKVTVTFSEPVQGIGLYYVNGQAAQIATPGAGNQLTNTVTLTTSNLSAGSTYSFQVINEKDTSGNLVSATQNFQVVSDTAAPVVSSVTPVGDNLIKVTFNKAMSTTLSSATTPAPLTGFGIKLLDGNGSDVSSDATFNIDSNDGGAHTTFDINLTSAAKSLFSTTTNQANLTLVFTNGIQDSLSNTMASTTRGVTLNLNQTAPAITSVQYVNPGATYDGSARTNGAVVVTFNENVTPGTVSGFTAIKDNGAVDSGVTSFTATNLSTANNVLILAPNQKLGGTSSETIHFNAGAFTDSSLNANTSAAVVETVDLTKGISTGDTALPVITAVYGHAGFNGGETVTYNVADDDIDWSSVLNTSNYRLNGAALASGAYITTDGTSTVTINLPTNSVATTGNYSLLISGVKDLSGNVANTSVTNNVYLDDNTAPTVKSATFNADHSMTVAFTESVAGVVPADLVIKDNGNVVSSSAYNVAPGTGSDAGKVVVTFTTQPATGHQVTVSVATGTIVGHDTQGNFIANGSSTVSAYAN